LYVELYIGMCRALAAPWLSPWLLDSRSGPRSSPRAQLATATESSAAEPPAAATKETPQPQRSSALIIPFDRARARHAAQH
jgi:hypothetical protein